MGRIVSTGHPEMYRLTLTVINGSQTLSVYYYCESDSAALRPGVLSLSLSLSLLPDLRSAEIFSAFRELFDVAYCKHVHTTLR